MFGCRRISAIACVLLLACGFTAAAQEKTETPPGGRSIVRLSYVPGNAALPVLVGIEHGMFAREGISVSAIPVTDESVIMRSLTAGATDFAIGSQAVLLSAAQNKVEAKVVAIAGYGRDVELIVPAWDTTTKSLADVKGKAVLLLSGIHNFDAVPELYRALALSKPPMRISDITIHFITLANLQQVMDPKFRPTYTQRKIAGIFMFREFTSRYVDDKSARVVINDEEFTKLTGRVGAQPLFASKLVIDRYSDTVHRFVRAWARTLQHMSDPKMRPAVVRVLQIYYLRQYGGPLKQELAEYYVGATKWDRVAWTDKDIAEVTINGRALSAARNVLFASITDPKLRPFAVVPDIPAFMDMSFATKALAELEAERKAAGEKPPETPPKPPAKGETPPGEKPPAAPPGKN